VKIAVIGPDDKWDFRTDCTLPVRILIFNSMQVWYLVDAASKQNEATVRPHNFDASHNQIIPGRNPKCHEYVTETTVIVV
jgi:hypothetical protein